MKEEEEKEEEKGKRSRRFTRVTLMLNEDHTFTSKEKNAYLRIQQACLSIYGLD